MADSARVRQRRPVLGQDFSRFDLQKATGRFRYGFTDRSQGRCGFVISRTHLKRCIERQRKKRDVRYEVRSQNDVAAHAAGAKALLVRRVTAAPDLLS